MFSKFNKLVFGVAIAMLATAPALAGGLPPAHTGGHHWSGKLGGSAVGGALHSPGWHAQAAAPTAVSPGARSWSGKLHTDGTVGGHSPGWHGQAATSPATATAIKPAATTAPAATTSPIKAADTLGCNPGDTNCIPTPTPTPTPSTSVITTVNQNQQQNATATATGCNGCSPTAKATGGNGFGGSANAQTGASTSSSKGGNQSLVNNVAVPSQGNNSDNSSLTVVNFMPIVQANTTENVEKTVVLSERRKRHVEESPCLDGTDRHGHCIIGPKGDAGSDKSVASGKPNKQSARSVAPAKKPKLINASTL